MHRNRLSDHNGVTPDRLHEAADLNVNLLFKFSISLPPSARILEVGPASALSWKPHPGLLANRITLSQHSREIEAVDLRIRDLFESKGDVIFVR